jgi:hypothetical protein
VRIAAHVAARRRQRDVHRKFVGLARGAAPSPSSEIGRRRGKRTSAIVEHDVERGVECVVVERVVVERGVVECGVERVLAMCDCVSSRRS